MLEPKAPREEMTLDDFIAQLELLVVEVEGCLTDGSVITGPGGEESLVIHRRDALALTAWRESGKKLVVMAREDLDAARAWCQRQGLPFRAHNGQKAQALQLIVFEHELTPDKVAYMGAELDDLPALLIPSITACPADANPFVEVTVKFVTRAPGGRGAVAELVDRLMPDLG